MIDGYDGYDHDTIWINLEFNIFQTLDGCEGHDGLTQINTETDSPCVGPSARYFLSWKVFLTFSKGWRLECELGKLTTNPMTSL